MLLLVRHARTMMNKGVRSEEWRLDPAGLVDLERLRTWPGWSRVSSWYSSPERKALDTAAALANGPVNAVDGLREVQRWSWLGDYEEAVVRLFGRPDVSPLPDWESGEAALRRFDLALRTLVAPHRENGDIAVVTHGLVLSLWRAHL